MNSKTIYVALATIVLSPVPTMAEKSFAASDSRVLRLACMGDSITYGTGVDERGRGSYPAVLQQELGADWEVGNFSVPGRTMLKEPEDKYTFSYWDSKQKAEALAFEPDVVVLMLGTNDSWKDTNWQHKERFVADYHAMLDLLAGLPASPRILLCTPRPVSKIAPSCIAIKRRWLN